MRPTCSICGRARESEELLGSAYGRCEKIVSDVEAEAFIERWREHYNGVCPHNALGYRPPAMEAIGLEALAAGCATQRRASLRPPPTLHSGGVGTTYKTVLLIGAGPLTQCEVEGLDRASVCVSDNCRQPGEVSLL